MADKKIIELTQSTSPDPTYLMEMSNNGTQSLKESVGNINSSYFKSVSITANYTTQGERFIFVTDSSSTPFITLSTADFNFKRKITVVDLSGNASINGIPVFAQSPNQFINNYPYIDLRCDNGQVTFYSNGTNWLVVGAMNSLAGKTSQAISNTAGDGCEMFYGRSRYTGTSPDAVLPGDTLRTDLVVGRGPSGGNFGALETWTAGSYIVGNDVSVLYSFGIRNNNNVFQNVFSTDGEAYLRFGTPYTKYTTSVSATSTISPCSFVKVNATTPGIVLTIPDNLIVDGLDLTIQDVSGQAGVNFVTVNCQSGQLLNGSSSAYLTAPYAKLSINSDGTNLYY